MEKELIKTIEKILEKFKEKECGACEASGYFVYLLDDETGIGAYLEVDNEEDGDIFTETITKLYISDGKVYINLDDSDVLYSDQSNYFQKSILSEVKEVLYRVREDLG